MKKVTVGIVLFGKKYLEKSIPSILDQDYPNIEFIFRDQEEGKYSAYKFLQENIPEAFNKAKITKGKNIFHSGGHNKIINEMSDDSEIYFCCSNDMLYEPDAISKIVQALEEEGKEYSFATGKSLVWDYENNEKTSLIDSTGLGMKFYHHFYDIGNGQDDEGQFNDQKDIFGVSGAFFGITKHALEIIKYEDEYFDELIHYKNDVDLSYRLRWAGQNALFVPESVVYHDRTLAKNTKKTPWMKASSFFGEKVLMKKNYSSKYSLYIRCKTRFHHFLKTCFLLITNPKLIKEYKKLRKHKREITNKRDAIKHLLDPKDLVQFMG